MIAVTQSQVSNLKADYNYGYVWLVAIVAAMDGLLFSQPVCVLLAGCTGFLVLTCSAGPLLPPGRIGNLLEMTNANVRLEYNLTTGRANFYWRNSLKITGFYSGVGLQTYIIDTIYTNRTWAVSNNEVDITSTSSGLPIMKQAFILDETNSFLARLDVIGSGLRSRWMGPVIVDTTGGVDIGSYDDVRALIVPFDNDSFTFSYNAMPINNTSSSYEVSAFYDNTSRYGLVVGSVTHDTWKTGIYFQGALNKLNIMNAYGGITSSNTRDVMQHGPVVGNTISSPTVFVGFGTDWRRVMEDYACANESFAPRLRWNGGVPFGWNSWSAYGSGVSCSNATAVSAFIKSHLQTKNFNDAGVVYVNFDAFWSNLSDTQLRQFANCCHNNGQKAGIYWTPFVYWGTASHGSNTYMTGSTTYKWSDAYLRTDTGAIETNDHGIAIDPTHPGFRQMAAYYIGYFKTMGYDYLKMDFLSHGALEGVHYETNITTGIQAYNEGMQYIATENAGRMFLSESIAPIFPYQYAHARRIFCDASTSITDTERTMQAVSYGWWLNGRLYQFNDPDMMKFAGGTTDENQSRLINCAISGTVFLNSDDLASTTGQSLAQTYLTNEAINAIARSGISFQAVEGNTGTTAPNIFTHQNGSTWYVAVFNYSSSATNLAVDLTRAGISGIYTAEDLWSGALSAVTGTTWIVNLNAKQAKLFRLGTGSTTAAGATNHAVHVGGNGAATNTAIVSIAPGSLTPANLTAQPDGENRIPSIPGVSLLPRDCPMHSSSSSTPAIESL